MCSILVMKQISQERGYTMTETSMALIEYLRNVGMDGDLCSGPEKLDTYESRG